MHEGGPSRSTYVFKHALIQDAAYSTLVIARREQLHAQCADILEATFAPDTAGAPHRPDITTRRAGKHEQAVGFWLKAGRRAAKRSANLEAIVELKAWRPRLVKHYPVPGPPGLIST